MPNLFCCPPTPTTVAPIVARYGNYGGPLTTAADGDTFTLVGNVQSVTVFVLSAGAPDPGDPDRVEVTTPNGTRFLPVGETVTWSVDSDNNALTNLTLQGFGASLFDVSWTVQ